MMQRVILNYKNEPVFASITFRAPEERAQLDTCTIMGLGKIGSSSERQNENQRQKNELGYKRPQRPARHGTGS